ncbi:hypothetical protein AML91_11385 [Paenibacillus jilunlii]|uniref:Uncharacterized protein n=1 Tax=Paenibacillus jilunlii TaxID=682956 RepID=A0ABR5SWQ3_9BACL|nr:hypothetical protein AML91_11385 [Paenibacillus jilunlii]
MRFYTQISPCASILATKVAWPLPWLDFHQLDNAYFWARKQEKKGCIWSQTAPGASLLMISIVLPLLNLLISILLPLLIFLISILLPFLPFCQGDQDACPHRQDGCQSPVPPLFCRQQPLLQPHRLSVSMQTHVPLFSVNGQYTR